MRNWVSVQERLPEQYRDVPILNKDGSQRVARLNHQGVWEMASYQKCRHAYAANPVMWFDTPEPPQC